MRFCKCDKLESRGSFFAFIRLPIGHSNREDTLRCQGEEYTQLHAAIFEGILKGSAIHKDAGPSKGFFVTPGDEGRCRLDLFSASPNSWKPFDCQVLGSENCIGQDFNPH